MIRSIMGQNSHKTVSVQEQQRVPAGRSLPVARRGLPVNKNPACGPRREEKAVTRAASVTTKLPSHPCT